MSRAQSPRTSSPRSVVVGLSRLALCAAALLSLGLTACDSEESEPQSHAHAHSESSQVRSEQRSWTLQPGLATTCMVACGRPELQQCSGLAHLSDNDNCKTLCVQGWADVLDKKGDTRCGWASYNYLDCTLEQSCGESVAFTNSLLNPAAAAPAAGSACAVEYRQMSEECAKAPAAEESLCPSGRARDDSDFLDCE